MGLTEQLISSVDEIMESFGFETKLQGVLNEKQLISVSQVNVLMGLSDGINGNIVFGLQKSTALKIASGKIDNENNKIDDV